MIKPKCDRCKKELKEYGGLAFSPPDTLLDGTPAYLVWKYHICAKCWKAFIRWIKDSQ